MTTRTQTIGGKFTPEEEELVKKRADALGLKVSEYARHQILSEPLAARFLNLYIATIWAQLEGRLTLQSFAEMAARAVNAPTAKEAA